MLTRSEIKMIFFIVIILSVAVRCEHLNLYFYRRGRVTMVPIDDYDYILKNPNFNQTKPTVLYIHGFTETQSSNSVKTIVAAYEKRNRENLLSLGWSHYSGGSYIEAARNVDIVGSSVTNKLYEMFGKGLDISKLHIVGHSLGAQLAGSIGRKLQIISSSSMILPRITGLDPANPLFTSVQTWFTDQSLHSSNAQFVDIIHTDYGLYGTGHSMGHANFFPNGGRRYQPGCPTVMLTDDSMCSHRRSWLFWSESLVDGKQFVGKKAESYLYFLVGMFIKNGAKEIAVMGVDCDQRAKGSFFLRTAKYSPFALGHLGY
ncbi:hypothetical protein ACFFRR_004370 [Megaselia abdita]